MKTFVLQGKLKDSSWNSMKCLQIMFDEGLVFNTKDVYNSIMKVKYPNLRMDQGPFSKNILKWPINMD